MRFQRELHQLGELREFFREICCRTPREYPLISNVNFVKAIEENSRHLLIRGIRVEDMYGQESRNLFFALFAFRISMPCRETAHLLH